MKILHHIRDNIQCRGYAGESINGYISNTPPWISRRRNLHRFISDGRKHYKKLNLAERIVFLIADAENEIATKGWIKCFTDDARISRVPELINALEIISESHTISIINDFINQLANHDHAFDSASVIRHKNNYPFVEEFWNKRFMAESKLRWDKLNNYFLQMENPAHADSLIH